METVHTHLHRGQVRREQVLYMPLWPKGQQMQCGNRLLVPTSGGGAGDIWQYCKYFSKGKPGIQVVRLPPVRSQ